MFYQSVPKMQQSVEPGRASFQAPIEVGACTGGWQLAGNQALTLKPTRAGVVRVVSGRVWATLSGPHGDHPDDSGDVVLVKGQALDVPPHQRLVLEPWHRCASDPAFFRWEPLVPNVCQNE
jgi:hypothetical protein